MSAAFTEFSKQPLWVAWRIEVGHDGKENKVPINPKTGSRAKSNDSGTWGTHAQAQVRAVGMNGIGINLADIGDGFALAGIDLDTCRDPVVGTFALWAQKIIERFGTYTEVSPSERGAKVFFRLRIDDRDALIADLRAESGDPDRTGAKWVVNGHGGEHPPAAELYLSRRYFTVTEQPVPGTLENLRIVDSDEVRWLIREAGPALCGKVEHSHEDTKRPRDSSRSGLAFHLGLAMRRAGKSFSDFSQTARADPETSDWCREAGERGLRRIWDKAERIISAPPHQIDPKAPYTTARLFRELHYDAEDLPTLYQHRGAFHAWTGTAYPEIADPEVRAQLYSFLDQCVVPVRDPKTDEWRQVPVKPNTNLVNNVLDGLRADALLPATVEAPAWLDGRTEPHASEIIACANGLLHLPTARLLPHTPGYFTHNALDFAYDPWAPAPVAWLDFLEQLWGDDGESITALQQIFGYCLGADTDQQKAFLLVGPKRSGKGTIARVLTSMLGAENVVAPTLAGLGTNFGLQPLIGKRAAIISDARLSGRADQAVIAERLLSITGEDGITIDRKYREGWTGRLMTRFLILTNELPRLTDASGALASRFIVLVLTESFYGREDPGLTNRLLGELPGILNWAIEGWRRLRERGYFEQPPSALEVVAELEDLGSPIGAFLRDQCVTGAGGDIEVGDLFFAWEEWCLEQRRERPGDRQTFGRNLRAAVPGIKVKQRRKKEGMERYYEGIRRKTLAEMEGREEGPAVELDFGEDKVPF